jgi:hypothetical protein
VIRVEVVGMADVQRRLAKISRELAPQVIQPALNKVVDKARAEATRAITAEYAVKAADVRNSVNIRRAGGGRLEVTLEVFGSPSRRGRSMNLIRFLAVAQAAMKAVRVKGKKVTKADLAQIGRQLGFLIRRDGGIKTIPGAFVGNKGRTVFIRVPGKQMASRSGRLTKHTEAIAPLQVIGFSQMFSSRRILERVLKRIREEMPVEIDRAFKRLTA